MIGMRGTHWTGREQQLKRDNNLVPQQQKNGDDYSAKAARKAVEGACFGGRGREHETSTRVGGRANDGKHGGDERGRDHVESSGAEKSRRRKERSRWIGEEKGRVVSERKTNEQESTKKQNK